MMNIFFFLTLHIYLIVGQEIHESPILIRRVVPNGLNRCTEGPAYFCQSIKHMKTCNAEKYCRNRMRTIESSAIESLIIPHQVLSNGLNRCTEGPAYFCRSIERMKSCNAEKYCRNEIEPNKDLIEPIVIPKHITQNGLTRCTEGPAYFCRSIVIARQCKMEKYCKEYQELDQE